MRSITIYNFAGWFKDPSNMSSILDEVLQDTGDYELVVKSQTDTGHNKRLAFHINRNGGMESVSIQSNISEHCEDDDAVISFIVDVILGNGVDGVDNNKLIEFREKIIHNELSKDEQVKYLDELIGEK